MDLTSGLLSRSGIKADSDGKIVARLRAAGAIPLLVSNTPELCRDFECNNYVTGRTNNPYDTTCTSGGSSGGEGALLGAGASVIGVGSDIAGSIRVPGCFNGVFGHKPTPRIATIKGHFPYVQDEKYPDFLVIGPMTRYAEDLKLVMNIIADPQQKPFLRLNEKVNTRKLNIFFMEDAGSFVLPTVQSEIKTAVRRAVEYLNKHCGATIKDKKFTEIKDSIEVCATDLYTMKDIPNPLKGDGADNAFFVLCEFVKSVMGKSKYTPNLITSFIQEKALKSFVGDHSLDKIKWRHNFVNTLGDNGVFIFPTIPSRATKHNKSILTAGFAAYVVMPNSLGLPSTSVPCGLDRKGMPIGIQVIAAPNQDRLCLAVAEELEKCFGGWVPP